MNGPSRSSRRATATASQPAPPSTGARARSAKTRDAIADALLDLLADGELRPDRQGDRGPGRRVGAVGLRALRRPRRPLLRRGQAPLRAHRADARARCRRPARSRSGRARSSASACGSTPRSARSAGRRGCTRSRPRRSPASCATRTHRSRADLERVFARELDAHDADARDKTVAVLDVLTGADAWQTLREPARSRRRDRDAVRRRLDRRPTPGGAVTATSSRARPDRSQSAPTVGRRGHAAVASPLATLSMVSLGSRDPARRPDSVAGRRPASAADVRSPTARHPPMSFVLEASSRAAHEPARGRHRDRLPREPDRELRRGRPRRRARRSSRCCSCASRRLEHLPRRSALGLVAAIVLGVLVEFLFLRRFFNAPRLILTVATIGVTDLLVALGLLPARSGSAAADDDQLPAVHRRARSRRRVARLRRQRRARDDRRADRARSRSSAFFRFSAIGVALRATRRERRPRVAARHPGAPAAERRVGDSPALLAFVAMFLRIGVDRPSASARCSTRACCSRRSARRSSAAWSACRPIGARGDRARHRRRRPRVYHYHVERVRRS